MEAIASRLEAIAVRCWGPLLLGEAIAIRLEAIAVGLEAIAVRLEAIAVRCWGPLLFGGGRITELGDGILYFALRTSTLGVETSSCEIHRSHLALKDTNHNQATIEHKLISKI